MWPRSGGIDRSDCRELALRTLGRILDESWDSERGFAHRVGKPRLEGVLDDQVFTAAALLDAYEATLDRRYFETAERAMQIALARYFDAKDGGFFDRASDAPPMGGLDVRRKPFQDSPTPGTNSIAAVVLDRLYAYTMNPMYRGRAEQTLEAFAGIAPQYGLFAASYGLAAMVHAQHPLQVVVTGKAGDPVVSRLEHVALGYFRYAKAVLRVTPECVAGNSLAPALQQTIPRLQGDVARALVCVNAQCYPPVDDPEALAALLAGLPSGAAPASGD